MELLPPGLDVRILRYKPLQHLLLTDDAQYGIFWGATLQATGNRYNWLITRAEQKHKLFCSELVANVFKYMGFDIFDVPYKLLPTKIDRISRENCVDWDDVTDHFL